MITNKKYKNSKKTNLFANKDFNVLVGMSKDDVIDLLKLCYNDIHCNVWMYRVNSKPHLLKQNYLYIIFRKNIVINYSLRVFKTNKHNKKTKTK